MLERCRDAGYSCCQKCGRLGHRKYNCPDTEKFMANVICRSCSQVGHLQRDCKFITPQVQRFGTHDQEYHNLVAEINAARSSC